MLRTTNNSVEKLLAWTAIIYGLTLLNPWTEIFPTYQSYAAMAKHGSETLWGMVLVGVGIGQLVGACCGNLVMKKVSTFFAALLWGFLAWLSFTARIEWTFAGVLTALTSPGVVLSMLWGWVLAYKGFKLR